LHRGENLNPGLKLLTALTRYFQVDLDFFTCSSRAACREYLDNFAKRKLLDVIAHQCTGLSDEAKAYVFSTIDYIRRAEGLPPC
jgi:transcriptional regulator with XRE-family HTH domain